MSKQPVGSQRDTLTVDEQRIPIGTDFLELVRSTEAKCESYTDEAMPKLGERGPRVYANTGTVLSFLDRIGSCFWGCQGGNHAVEYLAGRACGNGRSVLRLMRAGFYDEALGLTRGVGEVCNLLHLFTYTPSAVQEWAALDSVSRRTTFSPVAVRRQLEELAGRPIVEHDRYGALSAFAAHPDPASPPQAHNILGVPSMGGVFQEAGVLVVLNELALAAGGVVFFASLLAQLPKQHSLQCRNSGMELIRSLGRLEVMNRKEMWEELAATILQASPQDEAEISTRAEPKDSEK